MLWSVFVFETERQGALHTMSTNKVTQTLLFSVCSFKLKYRVNKKYYPRHGVNVARVVTILK